MTDWVEEFLKELEDLPEGEAEAEFPQNLLEKMAEPVAYHAPKRNRPVKRMSEILNDRKN